MTKEKLQAGFAPFIIIAIIAVLAIGGGAYVVSKNRAEVDTSTQANEEADANANANANLGLNAKGSLRSLMGMGKSVMCTFESAVAGENSSGTMYISSSGEMRGDFTMQASGKTQTAGMLVKGETSYMWSGSSGVKMATQKTNAAAAAGIGAKSSVDLDLQVDYTCKDWTRDETKFVVPSSVEFVDLQAMMNGAVGPGNINLKNAAELGY